MSYVPSPESNPYAAPASAVDAGEVTPPSAYVGYSGFWRRFAAYFIDYILMFIVSLVGGFAIGVILALVAGQNFTQQYGGVFGALFGLALYFVYYVGMESSAAQATLGKQALGVKVTDLYGRRISFGRALGRRLGMIVSGLIFGIGFIMIAFTEKKQGLHDMMAGTLVLKTR